MKYILCAVVIAINIVWLTTDPVSCRSAVLDSPLEVTQATFRQVPCMQEGLYNYHKDTIRSLSYTRMRALRAFCTMPDITADEAIFALQQLVFHPITFDQVQLLEFLSGLPGAQVTDNWQLLRQTDGFAFTTMQAVISLKNVSDLTPETTFELINTIQNLNEGGRWAAKTFLSINTIDAPIALSGIRLIAQMDKEQSRAAEQACLIPAITPPAVLELFQNIRTLPAVDAVNSRALFADKLTTPDSARAWLKNYFTWPHSERDTLYQRLSNQQKATVLRSYSNGSGFLIRRINDLHSVTDQYGAEIRNETLVSSTNGRLKTLFTRLHPTAQSRFQEPFYQALRTSQRHKAVTLLRKTTTLARKLTASDLSSANIYILLSRGSELYDSSFRDILVPVLLKRLNHGYRGNLLDFLLQTDPLNNHVSDFIIGCAQKGKLTVFFPKNSGEQRKILDLMTNSAFQDEESLILFSATFATLLDKLQPEARTYLLKKMIEAIQQGDSNFALQLRVILQYYDDKHPDLLRGSDRKKITGLIEHYGRVDLTPYITTDFKRWKEDGRLQSLSIFQHDDDGKLSYLSNSRNLIRSGYLLRISDAFSLLPQNSPALQEAVRLVRREQQQPASSIQPLYQLSVRYPIVFEWYKTINGIELSHAVAVYQNESIQRQLLKQFLQNNMEMFAQRGHSYWREEQLLQPMRELLESEQITSATISNLNRFMSIGSCGGIRVYSELNRLFNNSVDIFATVGTGKAIVNDPYNRQLFEIVASSAESTSWEDISRKSESIFAEGRGSDYLQPGSLPAILHKMMDSRNVN